MKKTTIQVTEKTWKELNKMKALGESMDEVISRLIAHFKKSVEG